MYGYIYLTTNLVNNKRYIGQHRATEFDRNYIGSGRALKRAISKYGFENFKCEILKECFSEDELNEQEKVFIEQYNAVSNLDFYNIQSGGLTKNSIHLKSMYNKDTGVTVRVSEVYIPYYIKKGFELGYTPRTAEQKEHYKGSRGKRTIMTNDAVTVYAKPNEVEGLLSKGYMVGRIATRPNQKVEQRKWVNNGVECIMVKSVDLDTYINKGYSLGRLKFTKFERVAPQHNKGKKLIVDESGKRHYVNKDKE